jgi:plastocyanin
MRRPITLLALLLLAGAFALAGCGGGGSKSSSTSSGGASTSGGGASTTGGGASTSGGGASTTGGGGSTAGGGVVVKMQNISFNPGTVTVKVGQKITWVNEDSVPHNVTAKSGAKIASATFAKGGTFSFTPTKAGTIQYVCTIHPGMNGTIVVQ